MMRLIVAAGPAVDVNWSCFPDGSTTLHCAAFGGSLDAVEAVRMLLAAGADVTAVDFGGHRPLGVVVSLAFVPLLPFFQKQKDNSGHCSFSPQSLAGNPDSPSSSPAAGGRPSVVTGKMDIGWEYCTPVDASKKQVVCNFCGKTISGGIYRLKQHLAGVKGNVAVCKKVPEADAQKMRDYFTGVEKAKKEKQRIREEIGSYGLNDLDMEEMEVQEQSGGCSKSTGKRKAPIVESAKKKTSGSGQMRITTALEKKAKEQLHTAVARFFYHCAIPFHVVDSPYFQKMIDVAGKFGNQGIKPPARHALSGNLLTAEVTSINASLEDIKASWKTTGCSIMSDGWTNQSGRTLINFLVYCPRGMYFPGSVDVSDKKKDGIYLFSLLDKVVEEVGEENVVQVITDNASAYKAAGKMLEHKRPHLFWTPCAAHCINLMLKDFAKIKKVGTCITNAQKVTKLIYNYSWLLALMRNNFTNGHELVRPGATRFATHFLTIASFLKHKQALKKMFVSEMYSSSKFAKEEDGITAEGIVLSAHFWKMEFVHKTIEPLVQFLRLVDSDDRPSMPFVYDAMQTTIQKIKEVHDMKVERYKLFVDIINKRWASQFCHPLHAAAYMLNSQTRYRSNSTIRGVSCIQRCHLSFGSQ